MQDDNSPLEQTTDQLLNEAEQLIWALLDEQIADDDVKRLEAMIQNDPRVRQRYLTCVQLHADLHQQCNTSSESTATPDFKSPVLGSLGDLFPGKLPGAGSQSFMGD